MVILASYLQNKYGLHKSCHHHIDHNSTVSVSRVNMVKPMAKLFVWHTKQFTLWESLEFDPHSQDNLTFWDKIYSQFKSKWNGWVCTKSFPKQSWDNQEHEKSNWKWKCVVINTSHSTVKHQHMFMWKNEIQVLCLKMPQVNSNKHLQGHCCHPDCETFHPSRSSAGRPAGFDTLMNLMNTTAKEVKRVYATQIFSHTCAALVHTDWLVHWNPFSWTSASDSHHCDTNPPLICVRWDKNPHGSDRSFVSSITGFLKSLQDWMRLKSRRDWLSRFGKLFFFVISTNCALSWAQVQQVENVLGV